MWSIQDIIAKTEKQSRAVMKALEETSEFNPSKPEDGRGYHPEDASLYDGLCRADCAEIQETLNRISLGELLRKLNAKEILMKGNTASGASALVATKLYDTLIYAAKDYDVCDRLGYLVGPWRGGDLAVPVTVDGSYKPKQFVGGAKLFEVQAQFVQAALSTKGYGVPILGGEDLLEDEAYGIIEWHAEEAAKAVGKLATDLALSRLIVASEGDGTLNSSATGDTNETKWSGGSTSDVVTATRYVGHDEFKANTVACNNEAWGHSLSLFTGTNAWHPLEPLEGFDAKIGILDILISNSPSTHLATDLPGAPFTKCKSVVFDRNNALMTGRKRWMEIKNFSDPLADIGGAVVSFRQNSITLYKDSIYVLTET